MKKLLLMFTVFAGLATATMGFSITGPHTGICSWRAVNGKGFLLGTGHLISGDNRIAREFVLKACRVSYPGASCDAVCGLL